MTNEFDKHIAMDPEDDGQTAAERASELYSDAKERLSEHSHGARKRAGQAVEAMRENPGTVSTVAVLFGIAGFAVGWALGQSSARNERYWH